MLFNKLIALALGVFFWANLTFAAEDRMNRYPWWKYLIIAVALLVGLIYTLPNFFGEAPAVQLSSGKATIKLSTDGVARVETVLKEAGVTSDFVELDGTSVRARFKDTDTQIKARDAIARAYNPDAAGPRYIVALNLGV